jgi:hypothetical protein
MAYGPPQPAVPATPENTPWAILINETARQGLLTPENIQKAIDDPVMKLIADSQALKAQQAAEAQAKAQAEADAQAAAQAQADAAAKAKADAASKTTPTSTSTANFVGSTAPGAVGTSYGQASEAQINAIQQTLPELATALKNGTASLNFDANTGKYNLIDSKLGTPLGGDYQVQVGQNGQIGVNVPSGNGSMVQIATQTGPDGSIAPITASNILNVGVNRGAGGFAGGGQLAQDVVSIGLAYALPIAGEAIAASLSTAALTVPAYVGTAMAAVASGVAQGKTLEQAISSAAPSLIAAGVMDNTGLSKLSADITNNKQYQNVINNVAGSMIATASKGGTIQDVLSNAATTAGGTLIGQAVAADGVSPANASAVGQAIATNIATGSTVSGLAAGAGSLGASEAKQNAANRAVMDQVVKQFGDQAGATVAGGPQLTFLPLLVPLIGPLESVGILAADVLGHAGVLAYLMSLTQSGVVKDENRMISEIKFIKEALPPNAPAEDVNKVLSSVDPKLQPVTENDLIKAAETTKQATDNIPEIVITAKKIQDETKPVEKPVEVATSDVKPGGGGGSPAGGQPQGGVPTPGAPSTPTSPTTPTAQQTADQKIINLISQAPTGGPASATAFTPAPSSRATGGPSGITGPTLPPAPLIPPTPPGTTGAPGVTGPEQPPGPITPAPTGPARPPGPPQPPSPPGLPGDLGTGQEPGAGGTGVGAGLGGTGTGTGKGVGTGAGTEDGEGTGTGTGKGPGAGPGEGTGPGKGGGPGGEGTGDGEPPLITVGTSVIKPKKPPIKSAYSTIAGEYSSPLIQAVSAFRPAGEIESQATGKEREDVWNTESLRNALGI